jgi:two-component system, NtrC family, sensor histidine kinase KinB
MNLRLKLLLAQLPLAAAVAALGIAALLTVSSLGDSSGRILAQNYRSVLAAQRMKESIERLDSAALFRVAGQAARSDALIARHRPAFETELEIEEKNITEAGEEAAASALRTAWQQYQAAYDRFVALQGDEPALAAAYFRDIEPRFLEVKALSDEILAINQDAMVHKSDTARRTAERLNGLLTIAPIALLGLGIAVSIWLTTRLLRPLDSLSQAARRLGEGDLEARAGVFGKDEVAAMAREFNHMAEKLAQYRQSTLGELLQAQQAAQAVIDSIADPVFVFGVDGAVVTVNQAADDLLGLDGAPATQAPLARAEPPLRSAIEKVRDHVLAGRGAWQPQGFDEVVRTDSAGPGSAAADPPRSFLPRATPIYGERGISGATVILLDVTRLRRFDELKNDLVATVAHEFRTPLTSLHLAIHMCAEGAAGPVTDKQLDLLHAARQDCERLQSIVDDLLDLARLQSGGVALRREPIGPDSLVEGAVEAHSGAAQQAGITLTAETVGLLDEVLADRERIHLVFDNLIDNALRHTPAGGAVTVRAAGGIGGAIRFEVTDTGEGIAPEHLSRLFERFWRAPGKRGGGAGLGLAIAKEVVEAHGGTIGAASEPGRGSTFWFTLPVATGAGEVAERTLG